MKKCSSVVWQFFDRLEENNRCVAVLCKLCDSEYKYFGNTTNLRAHLMKKHPIQWDMRQTADDGKIKEPTIRPITNTGNTSPVVWPLRCKTQRDKDNVGVQDNQDDGDDEEVGTTNSLIEQMHNQDSNEEWLDDDYYQVEVYDHKRKRIKREVVTPPKRQSSYVVHNSKKSDSLDHNILGDSSVKDEYSVFGEYIANKLRKFKTPRTRGNIQQLITTILWQAEYGIYDDAEAVKRVLMGPVSPVTEQAVVGEAKSDVELEEDHSNISKQEMSENMTPSASFYLS